MIFSLLKPWRYTPLGYLCAILWNFCEVAGIRCPFAPIVFGRIIGMKGEKIKDAGD